MKKTELFVKNEEGAYPCAHCLRKKEVVYPKVTEVDGLYYARCSKCNAADPFDFLGLSKQKAIMSWNRGMSGKEADD